MSIFDRLFRRKRQPAVQPRRYPVVHAKPAMIADIPVEDGYMVATDHAIVASGIPSAEDAVAFADRIALIEGEGERIMVIFAGGIVLYQTRGTGPVSTEHVGTTKRPIGKGW